MNRWERWLDSKEQEVRVHKVVGRVAEGMWQSGDRIEKVASGIEKLGRAIDDLGHKVMGIGFWFSERRVRKLNSPPSLVITRPHSLPPVTITDQIGPIDLMTAARVFVQSQQDKTLVVDVPIVDVVGGQIDLGFLNSMPVGQYDLVIEYEGGELLTNDLAIRVEKLGETQKKG